MAAPQARGEERATKFVEVTRCVMGVWHATRGDFEAHRKPKGRRDYPNAEVAGERFVLTYLKWVIGRRFDRMEPTRTAGQQHRVYRKVSN